MDDRLIVTYDNCPPDAPTLCVARQNYNGVRIVETFQGDAALGLYYYLTGFAELINSKDIPNKVIEVGKYGFCCPLCRGELRLEKEDIFVYDMPTPKHCEHCGQKLDWSDWE